MSFPASPSNGQLATVNNIVYVYASASNSWTRTASANITVGNGSVASTSTTTGALVVQGGAGVSGNVWSGNLTTGTVVATNLVGTHTGTAAITSGSITGATAALSTLQATNFSTANAVITGGSLNGTPIGATSASTGAFTTGSFSSNISRNTRNVITNFSGNTAPATPLQGDEWFRGNTGVMYKYIYDNVSNTFNWIDMTSALYNANTAAIANTLALRDSGANLTAANFIGVASSAKYADLAEIYKADGQYAPGTVVVFGGSEEITVTTDTHDTRVAGVVSTNPAYLMNSETVGLPVAFTGRVPCLVQGPINKGDLVVTSSTAGVSQRVNAALYQPGCVIGKSLGIIDTNEIATIEVVVGRF